VTPLVPRPTAARRLVVAPRRCVASRAGVRMLSQGLARPCSTEFSVLPQRVWLVRKLGMQKEVFPAALREKSHHWVALSCDAHLLFARQGKIRQPCTFSLGDPVSCDLFLINLHFCAGNSAPAFLLVSFFQRVQTRSDF